VAEGRITPLGRQLLRYPLTPPLARVLLAAGDQAALVAAMIALVEAADRRDIADEGDLFLLGLDLAQDAHRRKWSRDVLETYKQLLRLAKAGPLAEPDRRAVTEAWLTAYGDRLAFRQDKAYHLADGRKATPSAGAPSSPLLVAIELHEVAGPGGRQATIPLYLPCEAAWVGEGEPEVVSSWDATRQRVVQERVWKAGGLTLRREALAPDRWDRRAAEEMLAAKLIEGERIPAWDEDVDQLVLRIKGAAAAWPELGISLGDEDWELIYHELAGGKTGASDIGKDELVNVLREYVGWEAISRIDREAPRGFKLPNGRNGKITYFEDAPPELSARLGDMLGLEGTMMVFGGRVQVLFDILAPNYRTVQKTFDMTGFWKNTYPEVKKELKRRYPKHPWP
jgi:ATP-dependent helicase HrpB